MTPGFTTHVSSNRRKQKRTLNTPMNPWEISDTYSELQMSVILMNTIKTNFLGIKFLRIVLKSQHSLAGVVLQNRQEMDLLIPEQGGIWAILNETCFWINTSSQVKKVSQSSRKTHISYWMSKNELENSQVATITGRSFSWWWGIWSWLMPLLIPVITILMLLMIVPCIINSIIQFVSVQVNMLQHAVTVQQGYVKLQATMENITHPNRYKDSAAWD